jgi:cytochrome c553
MNKSKSGNRHMKRFKIFLKALVALVVLIAGVIYIWSSMIINKEYSAESRNILLSSRPEVIARGERLARVFGCFHGCHGEEMEGEGFFDGWYIGRIISPNLTRAIDEFSLPEMEAMIRQGVRPDGTSIMAMPSASFATMSDLDLSAILSFISQHPKQDLDLGRSSYGIMPRVFLITGEFEPSAAEVTGTPWQGHALEDPLMLGEYLAVNVCSECHGMQLEGNEGFSPPLEIAKKYSLEDFRKLMSTGIGLGDRDLGLMTLVSEARFSFLTDTEVESLHQFLHAR